MQIVTINLPEIFLDALEKLTEYGLYPSRSEAIRVAFRDFLSKELQVAQRLREVHAEMKRTPLPEVLPDKTTLAIPTGGEIPRQ